jgi:hypothetical protein
VDEALKAVLADVEPYHKQPIDGKFGINNQGIGKRQIVNHLQKR